MEKDLISLSKTISHALRHEPNAYKLKLDSEGWVMLSDLIAALKIKGFSNISKEDILLMIEKSDKKRFLIFEDKIKAFYGHSTNIKIIKKANIPPITLFHGTSLKSLKSIMEIGLMPMKRQYVHLSEEIELAIIVAKRRKDTKIQILKINALKASNNGVIFYKEENDIWLADSVPQNFIEPLP